MLYPRRFSLSITTWRGATIDIPAELRVTFNAERNIRQIYQFAEITIYNLNPTTESDILKNAYSVTLSAGHENGPFGLVFKGLVRQVIRGKEDGTTYFAKLICVDGDDVLNTGFCNLVIGSDSTVRDIIQQVARSSSVPFDVRVDSALTDGTRIERDKVIFGRPSDVLRSLAIDNNASFYSDNGGYRFSPLSKSPPGNIPLLNAATGMVGIPHQVDGGIQVKTLINPAIGLDTWFKIDNKSIIQQQLSFGGEGSLQTLLDADGIYRVIEIRASGDTRGDEWYYSIIAISQAGALPLMLSDRSQSGG